MRSSVTPEQVWETSATDPAGAITLSEAIDESALDRPDRAHLAAGRGRAEYELGRNHEAIVNLEAARRLAVEPFRGRIGVSLGAAYAAAGRQDCSIELLSGLRGHDDQSIAALATTQLGVTQLHLGEIEIAYDLIDGALPVLEASPHTQDAAAKSRVNIGYLALVGGRLDEAEHHLTRAIDLTITTRQHIAHAASVQNLADVWLQRGDVASALALLEEARVIYESIGAPARNYSTLWDDMAEAARLAGLVSDAVQHARKAMHLADETDSLEKQADASFRLARCLIDSGDQAAAETMAQRAAGLFDVAQRPVWAARCRALLVETLTTNPTDELLADCVSAADELERAGWVTEAMSLRNRTAEVLLRFDRAKEAVAVLDRTSESKGESLVATIESAYRRALSDRISGTFDLHSLSDVRRTLQEQRARFSDLELRANTSSVIGRLRTLDIAHALEASTASQILVRDETWRSATLPDVNHAGGSESAESAVIELRSATGRLNALDRPDPDLVDQIRALEQRLRHQSMTRSTDQRSGEDSPEPDLLDVAEIQRRLSNDAVFTHLIDCDGQLHAIDVDASSIVRRTLGSTAEMIGGLGRLRRELAWALRVGADHDHRRVTKLLSDGATMADRIIDRRKERASLILSIPPSLLGFPWSLLAADAELAISLTTGPGDWLRRRGPRRGRGPGALGIIVGPDLESASRRTDHVAIAEHIGIDPTLISGGSTCDDAIAVLSSCDVVHIAAHGRYRSDAPRFSSLRLDDGDLHLHEFDRIADVAEIVVIAACDAARTTATGVAPVGVMPTLAGVGVGAILAPVTPIPDAVTGQLVGLLHDRLRREPPPQALRSLRELAGTPGSATHLTASAFVCFGREESVYHRMSS